MIEVKNVSKKFDDKGKMIIDDLSFTVRKGTIHGLVGPNGSGKTTLIKCMAGIYKTTMGEVLIGGESVYDNPTAKQRIGYVADTNIFFEEYTVKKMVKFFKGTYEKFDESEFEALNKVFKLPLNTRVGHLSKGQKMRLSFILNMAINPDVLILDEPTSGLDAIAKKELLDILVARVEGNELTVIISSHNLNDIERICDTLTMFDKKDNAVFDTVDKIKGVIGKYQVIFKDNKGASVMSDPRILHYSTLGSVYTVIWKCSEAQVMATNSDSYNEEDDECIKYFEGCGADLVEKIDISLEESFIYANKESEE